MKKIKAFLLLFILSTVFALSTVSSAWKVIEPPIFCTSEPDKEYDENDTTVIVH